MGDKQPDARGQTPVEVLTHFASAARNSEADLRREAELVSKSPVMDALLAASAGMLAVLNEHRQVVALNLGFLEMLGLQSAQEAIGLRPGEAVSCVHAHDHAGGCGTSRMCASCGAAISIVSALDSDRTQERLCCIQVDGPDGPADLYLSVRAHPLLMGGMRWVLLFLQDVSEQQNWALLQRVFFHDISNVVAALMGQCMGLEEDVPEPLREQARCLEQYSTRLAHEVSLQRMLLKAEAGEFALRTLPIAVAELLGELGELGQSHPAAQGKRVTIADRTSGRVLHTDPVVLGRVLANMLINALEATSEGGQVRLWCEEQAGQLVFCVSNPGEMPPQVAGRVFQRNFSTKGGFGRGLGTYSMKLFGEKILGGEIDFTSPGCGQTIFSFRLPLDPD